MTKALRSDSVRASIAARPCVCCLSIRQFNAYVKCNVDSIYRSRTTKINGLSWSYTCITMIITMQLAFGRNINDPYVACVQYTLYIVIVMPLPEIFNYRTSHFQPFVICILNCKYKKNLDANQRMAEYINC